MDPNQPNLDVYQMQAELEAQAQGYTPGPPTPGYGNYEADLSSARASYGDIPAMMMTGMTYVGAAGSGAMSGASSMMGQLGSRVMPARYVPPARVVTGYYGQYQQETGFLRGLAGLVGLRRPPVGAQQYRYGYYNAADIGERVGGGIAAAGVAAAGVAASIPGGSLGGMIGGALGTPFGPLGMMAGSAVGTIAGSILAYSGVDTLSDIVAQRRQIDSFLESSSFRYVGAGSSMADPRLGSGMSTVARRQVTDFMRKMDIRDPNLTTEDLSGILQGATSGGMFTGTRDIEDFKAKFKEIVDGVKIVSKTLGTSLQEGLQVMRDFRSINVMPGQMGTMMFQAEAAGKISGRTTQEVVGLGMQGAELYRGTGIEMKLGYMSNVMNLSSIRSSRDAGLLSQEAIVQAGGEEALAQRMTATGLRFMQSDIGRGFGASFFSPGAGPGGFNRDAFLNYARGGDQSSYVDLVTRGAGNLRTPGRLTEYEAYQDKFMSEMGKTVGGDTDLPLALAAMSEAKMMKDHGAADSVEAAFRLIMMKKHDKSASEADALLARIQNAPGEYRARMDAAQSTALQRKADAAMSTVGFGYLYRRAEDVAKGWVEPVVRPALDAIQNTREGAINFYEKNVVGFERYDSTGIKFGGMRETADVLTHMVPPSSSGVNAANLDRKWSTQTKATGIGLGTTAGLAASALIASNPIGWAVAATTLAVAGVAVGVSSWTPSVGKQMRKDIRELSVSHPSLKGVIRPKNPSEVGDDEEILELDALTNTAFVISKKDMAEKVIPVTTKGMTIEEADKIAAAGGVITPTATDLVKIHTAAFTGWTKQARTLEDLVVSGERKGEAFSLTKIAERLYDKNYEQLSKGEMAYLRREARDLAKRGMPEVQDLIAADEAKKESLVSQQGAGDIAKGIGLIEKIKQDSEQLAKSTGLSAGALTPNVAGNLAKAKMSAIQAEGAKTPEERATYEAARKAYLAEAETEYFRSPSAGTGTGGLVHRTFTEFINPETTGRSATRLADISKNMAELEELTTKFGGTKLQGMLSAQLKEERFAKDAAVIQEAFEKTLVGGAGTLSGAAKKLLGTTEVGAYLLKGEQVNQALEKAEERFKTEKGEKSKSVLAQEEFGKLGLKFEPKTTDRLLKNYSETTLENAKQSTTSILAQGFATEKTALGPGGSQGTKEAQGTEQGTGQGQEMVAANINLLVLSALNTLANNMKSLPK